VAGFFDPGGRLKPTGVDEQMRAGFRWACQYGRTNVVEFLLDRGMPLDARLRHDGQTGLHWAAGGGHPDIVRLLLERKAAINVRDKTYGGTPLGWALHGWIEQPLGADHDGYRDVVALLVAAGATVERDWLDERDEERPLNRKLRADPRMRAALRGAAR